MYTPAGMLRISFLPRTYPAVRDVCDICVTHLTTRLPTRSHVSLSKAIATVASMDVDYINVGCEEPQAPGSDIRAAAAMLIHAAEPLLHLPTPMDIDEHDQLGLDSQQQQSSSLQNEDRALHQFGPGPAFSARPRTSAAAPAEARIRLFLVLDTNVLLGDDGLGLLKLVREFFPPQPRSRKELRDSAMALVEEGTCGGAADASTHGFGSGGGDTPVAFSCVAVLPWTVLAELDELKAAWRGPSGPNGESHFLVHFFPPPWFRV